MSPPENPTILPMPSILAMTSAAALGTSERQSPPSIMRRRISVPEYISRLNMGEARTSNPASEKRRLVVGLLVYTQENGGHIDTTCATHTE